LLTIHQRKNNVGFHKTLHITLLHLELALGTALKLDNTRWKVRVADGKLHHFCLGLHSVSSCR